MLLECKEVMLLKEVFNSMAILSSKKQELFILVNGKTNYLMDMENIFIPMVNTIKVHLLMEFHMEKEGLSDKMVTFTKDK
jgi:hypothetical protein